MKVYLPLYGEENAFLPVEPKCTNIPYHQALIESATESSMLLCSELIHNAVNSTIFTSTGTVIYNSDSLETFLEQKGCSNALQVNDNSFILFAEESGKATDMVEDI